MADAKRTDRVVVDSGLRDYNGNTYDGTPVKRISWGLFSQARLLPF